MLSLLLLCPLAHADPDNTADAPPEVPDLVEAREPDTDDASAADPTEDLRNAVRNEDIEALQAALAAGADPWNASTGPTPVWMALDRPRAFLEAMVEQVPPERHAALIRVWARLDPEDPRRTVLDAKIPEGIQALDPDALKRWLEDFSPAEQEKLIEVLGLTMLPAAIAFPPQRLRRAHELFGDAWLPRVVWEGPDHYNYEALLDGPPLDEAHQQAVRAAWRELGFSTFIEAELMRQEFHALGDQANLMCGVTGRSTEEDVRGAFGRPSSGTSRRTEAHLYWPFVEVYLRRANEDMRVHRIYMTDDPQGCWSKGARLIGVPPPFARWVLGPEPWMTDDGASLTLFAGEDGHVAALELVWPQEEAP